MSLPRLLVSPLAIVGTGVALALPPTIAGASCHYQGTGIIEESADCISTRLYFSCMEADGLVYMCYDNVRGCFTDDGRWWGFTLVSEGGGDCFLHG